MDNESKFNIKLSMKTGNQSDFVQALDRSSQRKSKIS